MKKIILFTSAICLMAIVSCGGGKKTEGEKKDAPAETKAAVVDTKLVAEGPYEKLIPATDISPAYVLVDKPQVNLEDFPKDKDGYYVIFDGKSFKGWRGYGKDNVPPSWIIDDGAIHIKGSGMGEAHTENGGDLIFAHKFRNFEIAFDWKVAKGSNSGVFYLAQEIKGEQIWMSCSEYQVLDNVNHIDGEAGIDGNRRSASLYDMIPAKPQNAKPFGEWNTGAVVISKGTVFHKQNGATVLEYHLWTPRWNERVAESKFKLTGEYPLAYGLLINMGGPNREGYIGLQDHGEDVWFRNIRIKVLD